MHSSTIPMKLRAQMADDPFYHTCARAEALGDHECVRDPMRPDKDVEWEHALYFAGKKIQERFAIIPLCWWAHRGPGMSKRVNEWIALSRATKNELLKLSAAGGRDYFRYLFFLNQQYGQYRVVENPVDSVGISYGLLASKRG